MINQECFCIFKINLERLSSISEKCYTFVIQELFESIATANRRKSHDSQIVSTLFSK